MDEAGRGPPEAVSENWEALMADTEATAEQFREEGYEVVVIHSGDVLPLAEERALDVLAPGDEYDRLEEVMADADITESTVYGADEDGVRFRLLVFEDPDERVAVCCPVFFHESVQRDLGDRAREMGGLFVQVRPLSDETRVVFTLEDLDPLF
jgi:hypothetical protein